MNGQEAVTVLLNITVHRPSVVTSITTSCHRKSPTTRKTSCLSGWRSVRRFLSEKRIHCVATTQGQANGHSRLHHPKRSGDRASSLQLVQRVTADKPEENLFCTTTDTDLIELWSPCEQQWSFAASAARAGHSRNDFTFYNLISTSHETINQPRNRSSSSSKHQMTTRSTTRSVALCVVVGLWCVHEIGLHLAVGTGILLAPIELDSLLEEIKKGFSCYNI